MRGDGDGNQGTDGTGWAMPVRQPPGPPPVPPPGAWGPAPPHPPAPHWGPPPPPPPPGYGHGHPPQPGWWGAPYGGWQPAPALNGLAVASLVCGVVWMYWIGSILALVFGYVAKSQIDRSQGRQNGRGMAVAGIVLGWVGVGVLVLVVLLAVLGAATSEPTPSNSF
jgi:uncharacterized protein DUF4190